MTRHRHRCPTPSPGTGSRLPRTQLPSLIRALQPLRRSIERWTPPPDLHAAAGGGQWRPRSPILSAEGEIGQ
uniref:Uncharacterized protein n=1 Tax=Arundo donax TaxID=35708 RepID=A0A0A9GJA7_ARUDO